MGNISFSLNLLDRFWLFAYDQVVEVHFGNVSKTL